MILYLDASALVKRYVSEPGSTEVNEAIVGMASYPRDLPAMLATWKSDPQ